MTTPILNKKGEVKCRYEIIRLGIKDLDKRLYSKDNLINIIRNPKGKIIEEIYCIRVPLTKEWQENYLKENQGYKCGYCQDRGVIEDEEEKEVPCPKCDLGRAVKKLRQNEKKHLLS